MVGVFLTVGLAWARSGDFGYVVAQKDGSVNGSNLLPFCGLPWQKERFRVAAFTAELEGPKILVPWPFGDLWL